MRPPARARAASGALFPGAFRAELVDRPNRFLVRCRVASSRRPLTAFLPNPGRLAELLLPGSAVHLVEAGEGEGRATRFTAVAVEREGRPIVLHTHLTNAVARELLEAGLVPGLEDARVLRAEHRVGRSRFDFLLAQGGEEVLLEVKSCTLVSGGVAMFPDAVTARGRRHVEELAALGRSGARTAVLFVVHWPEARLFSPDYHTDLDFARALLAARDDVAVRAVAVGWDGRLRLEPGASPCAIPWELVEGEARDRGSYLLVLRLARRRAIEVGRLGRVSFPAGHYVYVGSAMAALGKRLDRHRRRGRKRMHWHVDWLREEAEVAAVLPIRASDRLECSLARAVRDLADFAVPGFGASDCSCEGHLFGFREDPTHSAAFQRLLLSFRMDRLAALAQKVVLKSMPTVQR